VVPAVRVRREEALGSSLRIIREKSLCAEGQLFFLLLKSGPSAQSPSALPV